MSVRDYKYIDQYKIISMYLSIISKHSGKKHYTIVHATFNNDVNKKIVSDLMKYLKLNETQAKWLLTAHTKNYSNIKTELLKLDVSLGNIEGYRYMSWAYKLKKYANFGYLIFLVMILISSIAIILGLLNIVEEGYVVVFYVFLPISVLSIIGMIYVFTYYKVAYQFHVDKIERLVDSKIKVHKIKMIQYLEYLPRRGSKGFISVFALKIYYVGNNKIKHLFYPLLNNQNLFYGSIQRLFNQKYNEVKVKLNKIESLTVSYDPQSKLIVECNIDLERIISD